MPQPDAARRDALARLAGLDVTLSISELRSLDPHLDELDRYEIDWEEITIVDDWPVYGSVQIMFLRIEDPWIRTNLDVTYDPDRVPAGCSGREYVRALRDHMRAAGWVLDYDYPREDGFRTDLEVDRKDFVPVYDEVAAVIHAAHAAAAGALRPVSAERWALLERIWTAEDGAQGTLDEVRAAGLSVRDLPDGGEIYVRLPALLPGTTWGVGLGRERDGQLKDTVYGDLIAREAGWRAPMAMDAYVWGLADALRAAADPPISVETDWHPDEDGELLMVYTSHPRPSDSVAECYTQAWTALVAAHERVMSAA